MSWDAGAKKRQNDIFANIFGGDEPKQDKPVLKQNKAVGAADSSRFDVSKRLDRGEKLFGSSALMLEVKQCSVITVKFRIASQVEFGPAFGLPFVANKYEGKFTASNKVRLCSTETRYPEWFRCDTPPGVPNSIEALGIYGVFFVHGSRKQFVANVAICVTCSFEDFVLIVQAVEAYNKEMASR